MIKIPIPIVRKILSYITILDLCSNPIQMILLMTVGLKGENSKVYREEIWNNYCNNCVEHMLFDTH
jgi:hypothetical protein